MLHISANVGRKGNDKELPSTTRMSEVFCHIHRKT